MDWHSLELLEFDRVCGSIATRAECDRARDALARWRPFTHGPALARECARLHEALRRNAEPGAWCAVGRGALEPLLAHAKHDPLDGPALVEVKSWLDGAALTCDAWESEESRERFPELACVVRELPDLSALRERLDQSLDSDGTVKDSASPALKRARVGVMDGERRLHAQLERWAAPFGEGAYVTRFGDRFVACVPAAGFSRKRGIVHDTSNSGQSLFVEPLEACEGNNDLQELRAIAIEEERRILRELAESVAGSAEALVATEDVLARLDALRARARWGNELGARALAPAEGALKLAGARHPLLALSERADTVVPLDLELADDARLLLVSGPNMGGKTILLKTVGLTVAMAHAALPVLAREGSSVPFVDAIVVDLGDEQSVDQGLSTFAAHLKRLRAMAEAAGPRALVLADELGAGTDPEEGAALGRALVEHFAAARAWGVLTTHLGSLKRVASEVAGVVNGSLEFDLDTLSPRYRFLPGIPGASHALSVASRLGFPEPLLARARTLTSEETRALERLLSEVGASLTALQSERAEAQRARADAEKAEAEHRRMSEEAKKSLADLRRKLTSESEAILARTRELWQSVQREARRADKSRANAETLKQGMAAIERDADALQSRAREAAGGGDTPAAPLTLAVGARVRVLDLGVEAEIVGAPDAEGRVKLRRGPMTITSHVNRLAAAEAVVTPVRAPVATYSRGEEAPQLDVDLRGMDVEEALREVDLGLDRAVLSGITELRIIHGIGKGILKTAVERHLRAHAQVESQRMGEGREGGRGVTVARLR